MGKTSKTVQWKLDKMVELYQSGLPAKACAEKVGSSTKVCLRELEKRGIPRRGCADHLKTPKKILDKIVKNYLKGMTMKEAVKEFGCSWSVCQDELKRRGISARKPGTYQSPSQKDKDKMIKNYLKGMTAQEAGESIGVTFTTCLKELKRRGIKSRDSQSYRRLPIDENFFEKIDTEEKAYWLGFITADGSVDEKRNILHFTLKLPDKPHLEKFLKAIKHPRKIQEYFTNNGNWVCKITISNKKLIADLVRCGIHQKKTFTVKPYKCRNKKLQKAYWRGIIDGDGHLLKNESNRYYIGLSGNIYMISGFITFVKKNGVLLNNKISKNGNTFSITTAQKNKVRKIAHLLYKDASIYLDRKYKMYQEIVA